MKYFKIAAFTLLVLFSISCNTDDVANNEPSSIEIANYVFNFPSRFVLEVRQGTDSYVGDMKGSGITLSFDYGWYTSPLSDLSEDEYEVMEDEIDGHFRQIVRPFDSQTKITRIHLFKLSDTLENPYGYKSLTVYSSNLSSTEQEMVIGVYENVSFQE